jgi:hypothetical protein
MVADSYMGDCPTCDKPLRRTLGGLADAQYCMNHHAICHACVAERVRPSKKERPGHAGLSFECPLCGSSNRLNMLHMFALLRGWDATTDSFADERRALEWVFSSPRRRKRA